MAADKQLTDKFEAVGDILQKSIKQWIDGPGEPITRVWRIWDQVVGETVAENAQPAFLKNRVLFVHVASSTWTQQLRYLKDEIIVSLNRTAGSDLVDDIKFRIGDIKP